MVTRAALYIRQSVTAPMGMERQRELTRTLAAEKGWEVVAVFEDHEVSATKVRGPETAWAKMLHAHDTFDAIVAVDLDRLLRTVRDLATLLDLGVIVATVSGDIDTTTAEGKFSATLTAAAAEFETGRRAERTQRALAESDALGLPMMARRPYGYEPDMITLRPCEAHVIVEATARIIAGESKGFIAKWLNNEGHPTFTGGKWTDTTVLRMLLRERNAGRFTRNGIIQAVSQIQAAVPPDQFDQCKAVLTSGPRERVPGVSPVVNWLSGLMRCGVCQGLMRPFPAIYGERGYRCESTRYRTRTRSEQHVRVRAHIAETKVRAAFLEWMSDDGSNSLPDFPAVARIEEKLTNLEEARATATDTLMTHRTNRRSTENRLIAIESAIRIITATRASETISTFEGRVPWASFATSVPDGWKADSSTFEDRLIIATAWWAQISVPVRRGIIRDLFAIDVLKGGRGPERVILTRQKLAYSARTSQE